MKTLQKQITAGISWICCALLFLAPGVASSQFQQPQTQACCCEKSASEHTTSSHTSHCGCAPCTICNGKVLGHAILGVKEFQYDHGSRQEFAMVDLRGPTISFAPPTPPPKVLV